MSSIPLVSVIIPMYNAERFIQPCLESVLNQTLRDFEVIVVDDVSTDRSVEIVEHIANNHPRGKEGRIHLLKRQKNSGGSAMPRNLGMRFAHGKYITFVDNDDLITKTALEEICTIAEQTNADVVHAEKWLSFNGDQPFPDPTVGLSVMCLESGSRVTMPEVITADVGERVIQFAQHKLFWHVWSKLFRRDFINENCLDFPNLRIADDMMFSFFCLCLAKNYVRIPNVFNIYRIRNDSALRNFSSLEEKLCRLVRIIVEGTKILDEFMSDIDFFIRHSELKHIAIDFFIQNHINQTITLCNGRPPHLIEDLLHKEFAVEMGDNAALISYMFNLINVHQLQLVRERQTNEMLSKQIMR